MSQAPSPYAPQTSFSTLAVQPVTTTGLPGTQLDAEFLRLGQSANAAISRLSELQRDDGALRNGVVRIDSLGEDTLALVISLGANPKTWFPNEEMRAGDLISNPTDSAWLGIGGALMGENIYEMPASVEFPPMFEVGQVNGRPAYNGGYVLSGGPGPGPFNATWNNFPARWTLESVHPEYSGTWRSSDNVAFPWQCTTWVADAPATGVPVLTFHPSVTTLGTYLCTEDHTATNFFAENVDKWALIAAKPEAGDLIVDSFVGDGVETDFVLSEAPLEGVNTQVFIDGVYQSKSVYSLAGDTIIFAAAPANATEIEVVSGIPAQKAILTVSDFSITTNKLAAFAVTNEKLADSSVDARVIADDSVNTANLIALSVTTEKLAEGSVTLGKLANASVSTAKIADGAVTTGKLATSAVTAAKLASGSVTSSKIAAGPLLLNGTTTPTSAKHAVTKEYLERDGSVSQQMLAPESVVGSKIADGVINGKKFSLAAKLPCQFLSVTQTVTQTIAGSASSWTDLTDLSITITRVNNTGMVRVQATIPCASSNSHPVAFRIVRGGTAVGIPPGAGSRLEATAAGGASVGSLGIDVVTIDFLDDLAADSAATRTYKVQARTFTGATAYINRSISDPNDFTGIRGIATLSLTEITG